MSKKLAALVLTLVMLLSGLTVFAEETDSDYDSLAVGTLTAFRGNFLDEMWGNSTSDLDVHDLLHGYDLVKWQHDLGSFVIDESVVSGIFVTQNGEGDRTYRISLYNDLYYSDGTQIKAADYAFAMLLKTSPEARSLGANTSGYDYIVGARERRTDRTEILSGVRILGDFDFSLKLRHEYLPSFYELGLISLTPLPISVIAPGCEVADDGAGVYIRNTEEYKDEAPRFTTELLKETLLNEETGYLTYPAVVSGPYTLTSFDGTRAEFELNPFYKGDARGAKPVIRTLSYEVVSPENLISALEDGSLDLLNKVTATQSVDRGMELVTAGRHRVSNYPRTGASFFSFSCERIATGEAAVRRAIAQAIDRDTMIADYVGDYGMRVDGYYGIGQWMFEMVNGTIALPAVKDQAEAKAQAAKWAQLSMDAVPVYAFDTDAAARQLAEAGWTLNEAGEAYDASKDDVRCKAFDRAGLEAAARLDEALDEGAVEMTLDGVETVLVPLRLKLIYPEGNAIANDFEACVVAPLKTAGVALEIEAMPMEKLLDSYYRTAERDCDIIYLASNFSKFFDPALTFNPDDAYTAIYNRTGLRDVQLYDLAVKMRSTEPGNLYDYCESWIAFQQRYQEIMPALSVYSNAYFDFYTDLLQDYTITQDITWSQAILGAYLSDARPEETAAPEAE